MSQDERPGWQVVAEERTAQLHTAHAEIARLNDVVAACDVVLDTYICIEVDLAREVKRLRAVPADLLAAADPGRDYWAKGYREALRAVQTAMKAGE